jgi:hypothetical protein
MKTMCKLSNLLAEAIFIISFAVIIVALIFEARKSDNQPVVQEINPVLNALFPAGKPVGQSYSRNKPDIRMMRVDSYGEACDFFCSLCQGQEIRCHNQPPHIYYTCPLAGLDGYILFSNKVKSNTHEAAVLWIVSDSINKRGMSEVHFVETVKTSR